MSAAPRSKTLRQEHTEHTRQALIDAATRLFAERGYADTSIDDVAGAARVTRGALYHHFPGKQAIFNAVCQAVDADVVNRVRTAAAEASGTAEQRLRQVLDAYFDASGERAYRAIVLGEAHQTGALGDGQRYTPAMSDAIDEFVRSLAAGGEITTDNPALLRRLLCAILYEVASVASGQTRDRAAEEFAKQAICRLLCTD
jgi:AcrR family transcriptional regulator